VGSVAPPSMPPGRPRPPKTPAPAGLSKPLLSLLTHEPDPIVRSRAATALSGWTADPGAKGIAAGIERALAAETNPAVRWHEAWTLRRAFAVPTSAATIRAGLADRRELVRIPFA